MTDKELRERAEKVWNRLVDENSRISRSTLDPDMVDILFVALKDAYREGVEELLSKARSLQDSKLLDALRLEKEAARLLEATPNETTREAIEAAERGEGTTCYDAQTLCTLLGLDEEEKP